MIILTLILTGSWKSWWIGSLITRVYLMIKILMLGSKSSMTTPHSKRWSKVSKYSNSNNNSSNISIKIRMCLSSVSEKKTRVLASRIAICVHLPLGIKISRSARLPIPISRRSRSMGHLKDSRSIPSLILIKQKTCHLWFSRMNRNLSSSFKILSLFYSRIWMKHSRTTRTGWTKWNSRSKWCRIIFRMNI